MTRAKTQGTPRYKKNCKFETSNSEIRNKFQIVKNEKIPIRMLRSTAQDFHRLSGSLGLSLFESRHAEDSRTLLRWRPFDVAQDMLGARNFLEAVSTFEKLKASAGRSSLVSPSLQLTNQTAEWRGGEPVFRACPKTWSAL